MIIWGSKAKEQPIGSGTFFCPSCTTDATYSVVRVSRYFTLYFIPLFPTSTLGEYVRCDTCRASLPDAVLRCTREEILEAKRQWVCPTCRHANPRSRTICLSCGRPHWQTPPPLPMVSASVPPPSEPPTVPAAGTCPVCGLVRAHRSGCANAPKPPPGFAA